MALSQSHLEAPAFLIHVGSMDRIAQWGQSVERLGASGGARPRRLIVIGTTAARGGALVMGYRECGIGCMACSYPCSIFLPTMKGGSPRDW